MRSIPCGKSSYSFPIQRRDEQLRKIGNYKFENFEVIPLFNVYIEVIVDPKIVADWPSRAGMAAMSGTPG